MPDNMVILSIAGGGLLIGLLYISHYIESQKTKKALLIASLSERANRLQRLIDALPAAYLPHEVKQILVNQAYQRVSKLVKLAPTNNTFQKRFNSLSAQRQEAPSTPPSSTYHFKTAEEATQIKSSLQDLSKVIEALTSSKVIPINNAQQYLAFFQKKHAEVSLSVDIQLADQSYKDKKYRLAAHQYKKAVTALSKNNQSGEHTAKIEQINTILASLNQQQNVSSTDENTAATLADQVDKFEEKDNAWKKKYF